MICFGHWITNGGDVSLPGLLPPTTTVLMKAGITIHLLARGPEQRLMLDHREWILRIWNKLFLCEAKETWRVSVNTLYPRPSWRTPESFIASGGFPQQASDWWANPACCRSPAHPFMLLHFLFLLLLSREQYDLTLVLCKMSVISGKVLFSYLLIDSSPFVLQLSSGIPKPCYRQLLYIF